MSEGGTPTELGAGSGPVTLEFSLNLSDNGAVVWAVACPELPSLHITGPRLTECRNTALEHLRDAGVQLASVSYRLADRFVSSDDDFL